MLPKNLLQSSIKKMFDAPSCFSATQRKSKGASSFRELEEFHCNLTTQFDAAAAAAAAAAATNDNNFNAKCTTNPQDANSASRKRIKGAKKKVKIQTIDPKSSGIGPVGDSGGKIERAMNCLVLEKLEEMKLMDERNSEHLMDIEEVIHYYSLITSQTYLEIVDKFFVDLHITFSDCRGLRGAGTFRLVNL